MIPAEGIASDPDKVKGEGLFGFYLIEDTPVV